MIFSKIGIVGLGMMGGSLARLIRETHPEIEIWGTSRNSSSCDYALEHKIVDHVSSLEALAKTVDLAIICTPIPTISTLCETLSKAAGDRPFIMTDIGSVKADIKPQLAFNQHVFIPGHPMAGRAETGIQFSDASLMKGASYALVPVENSVFVLLSDFLKGLSFRVIHLPAATHDTIVALTSHLPYLVAGMLVETVSAIQTKEHIPINDLKALIGPGFRDTSRVAASDPNWGVDVVTANREVLSASLHHLESICSAIRSVLDSGDAVALKARLSDAKTHRDGFFSAS